MYWFTCVHRGLGPARHNNIEAVEKHWDCGVCGFKKDGVCKGPHQNQFLLQALLQPDEESCDPDPKAEEAERAKEER
jgi:hypothetical protein